MSFTGRAPAVAGIAAAVAEPPKGRVTGGTGVGGAPTAAGTARPARTATSAATPLMPFRVAR